MDDVIIVGQLCVPARLPTHQLPMCWCLPVQGKNIAFAVAGVPLRSRFGLPHRPPGQKWHGTGLGVAYILRVESVDG